MARPSTYTEELSLKICSQIAHGKSLVSICKQDGFPSVETVYMWLRDPTKIEFLNTYTRAREDQADTLADEIIGIADETWNDDQVNENGTVTPNGEWITRSRLRVDARKWVASKLKPKKYGDKIEHNGSGEGGEFITKMVVELVEANGSKG